MPSRTQATVLTSAAPLSRREVTAHHEAGHAVADLVLGVPIDEVSIRPNPANGSLGEVRGSAYEFYGISRRELRMLVRGAVISCYAGFEAERIVDAKADEEVSASHDYALAFELPMRFEVPPRGCLYCGDEVYDRWLGQRRLDAAALVRGNWAQVRVLAGVLLDRERLCGSELARAFRDAGGVVHDNLWYLLEEPEAS